MIIVHRIIRSIGALLALLVSAYMMMYAFEGLWSPDMEWLRVPFMLAPLLVFAWWIFCKRLDDRGRPKLATVCHILPAALVGAYIAVMLSIDA